MIQKNYICEDCGCTKAFGGYRQARRAGWAIARDYTKCYCPNCAPEHRRGQAAAKNDEIISELPDGWEQLKIV